MRKLKRSKRLESSFADGAAGRHGGLRLGTSWARELIAIGHEVVSIPRLTSKPYVERGRTTRLMRLRSVRRWPAPRTCACGVKTPMMKPCDAAESRRTAISSGHHQR